MAQEQVLPGAFLSSMWEGKRVLPLHEHRHRTHVNFTAVLGVDVLQHCVSG